MTEVAKPAAALTLGALLTAAGLTVLGPGDITEEHEALLAEHEQVKNHNVDFVLRLDAICLHTEDKPSLQAVRFELEEYARKIEDEELREQIEQLNNGPLSVHWTAGCLGQ